MAHLSAIVKQLKQERDHVKRQLHGLNAAISAFVGIYGVRTRKLTARARAKMAAAQKARWDTWRAKRGKKTVSTRKRKMSASSSRRIAAAQRARWAKVKAQEK